MNTIQIKHGASEPTDGVLKPYELGYNKADNGLYIGTEDGKKKRINEIQTMEGFVKTVNGTEPDENGNVKISTGPAVDDTLSTQGNAADAFVVGQALNTKLSLTGDTMQGILYMGNNMIRNLADPVSDTDAATKAYVDGKRKSILGTLFAPDWTEGAGCYEQTVIMSGLTSTVTHILDLNTSGISSADTLAQLNDEWGNLLSAKCDTDGLLYVAFRSAPEVDIPIRVEVI